MIQTRSLLVVAMLAGSSLQLSACHSAAEPPENEPPVLTDDELSARQAAAEDARGRLRERGAEALGELVAALGPGRPDAERDGTAEALRTATDLPVVPAVAPLLAHDDPRARLLAAFVLRWQVPASKTPSVREALFAALDQEPTPDARQEQATALAEIFGAEVVDDLLARLDGAARLSRLGAAASLGEVARASLASSKQRADAIVAALVRAAEKDDAELDKAVLLPLVEWSRHSTQQELHEEAAQAVIDHLDAADSGVREQAARVVTRLGGAAAAARPTLERLAAKDPSPEVREAARQALRELQG